MDINLETIIKKITTRAIDLFVNQGVILDVDKNSYQNEYFDNRFGIFVEIAEQNELISAFGNITSEVSLLDNLIFVLVNTLKSLPDEYIEKLKTNSLNIRIWIVESYTNIKGLSDNEKIYNISANKPAILINQNDTHSFCYLPIIWKEESDPIYILENLAVSAELNKDDWKNKDIDLITFNPRSIVIN